MERKMKKIEIILADHAGFCMGVKNAFNQSLEIISKYTHTVLLGDIVHNKFAIEKIKESGLRVENDIHQILSKNAIKNVIIRAHGVTPEIEKKLKEGNKRIFDLTCPIVKKVQLLTAELSKQKHDVLIFGKKAHPEVSGIAGYCKSNFFIVSSPEEAAAFSIPLNAPVLISQTTMNWEIFERIQKILSKTYPELIVHNTLCRNPLKTQESALEIANQVDLMIVIGDKKSSNTLSLYERVQKKTKTLFIESAEEITKETIKAGQKSIGITAGSSTPDFQIKDIIHKIHTILD